MKNVLFATTALVAMAGMASAEAGVSFSGSVDAGYNDVIEGGLFWAADLSATGSVDMGDNVTVTVDVELFNWSQNNNANVNGTTTVEIAYTGDAFSASLKIGDLNDKGASEYFYADRDGMSVDVENHDADGDARVLVEFGNSVAGVRQIGADKAS